MCVEGGEALFIALKVGFPPTHIWKVIRCLGQLLLLEVHLDGNQARFGRPRGSADPS